MQCYRVIGFAIVLSLLLSSGPTVGWETRPVVAAREGNRGSGLVDRAPTANGGAPAAHPALPVSQAPGVDGAAGQTAVWHIERAEGYKMFRDMGGRSLALDSAGHPHIAYGGDFLYYAWHDGTDWHLETVDASAAVGRYASLALDASDRPHISYYDGTNQDLKHATYDGGAWQVETVDGAGDVGSYTSLALDSADRPRISYYDGSSADLKYAAFDGSAWQIETVDSAGDVGQYTSLALDSSGRPHISYYDGSNADLKYAIYDGGAWQVETADSALGVGYDTSLALDPAGRPHISYSGFDGFDEDLRYATYDGSAWQVETVDIIPVAGRVRRGLFTSLALDSSDRPHISYRGSGLEYAYHDGSTWQIEVVEGGGDGGWNTSLALDASDRPHISYSSNGLQYATYDGGAWQVETVDSASYGPVGLSSPTGRASTRRAGSWWTVTRRCALRTSGRSTCRPFWGTGFRILRQPTSLTIRAWMGLCSCADGNCESSGVGCVNHGPPSLYRVASLIKPSILGSAAFAQTDVIASEGGAGSF